MVVEYPVLKVLMLSAEETLRLKAMSKKVTRYDAARQAAAPRLQSRV